MKLLRTVAMNTDHIFYGLPVEVSRVDLFISNDVEWTPEMIETSKRCQDEHLRSMAKRMPHSYWYK